MRRLWRASSAAITPPALRLSWALQQRLAVAQCRGLHTVTRIWHSWRLTSAIKAMGRAAGSSRAAEHVQGRPTIGQSVGAQRLLWT
mmetsp:Transcript_24291/g.60666  ORF Transcript_24291/g.60666 Transcript_24291/m.60666 type:complete len:86 (-) Transcript_24291:9-266(-)